MQLTLHADYSLRVLLYLATEPERIASTQEISEVYGISRHHLVRVMQTLQRNGFVRLLPGRTGGVRLALPLEEINLGLVVRRAEPNFTLVECFDAELNTCPIVPVCELKSVLNDALEAFFRVLDQYTLSDLVRGRRQKALSSVFYQLRANPRPVP